MDLPQLCHIALLVFSLNLPGSHSLTKPSSVKLENNGYTGIVVAIHHSEPEDPALIPKIKQMITNASGYLYEATNQRAFFKDVTILIPDTWEDKAAYESPRNETFEEADVIIAPASPRFAPGDVFPLPYTKHYEGCGKQAFHIHVTSQFLFANGTEERFGNHGKVFVHEWGHFRWGLFDEYANSVADRDLFKKVYYSEIERKVRLPICTREFDIVCLEPTKNFTYKLCENLTHNESPGRLWNPAIINQTSDSACIMSGYTRFEEVSEFCDDTNSTNPHQAHNAEAPNKHNKVCEGRSCWSVMRRHADFKDPNNSPRPNLNVTPSFRLVYTRPKRIVLVLDTSGSMAGSRISKLATSARNFLTTIVVDGTFIGIVRFNGIGTIVTGLREIDSDETRRQLADLIPTTANGGTCIGCGLDTALQILTENGASSSGGLVVLISDGQDNVPGTTAAVAERYVDDGVTIHGIAFSNTAEQNLVALQEMTGGKLFLQTDDPSSTGLYDAFTATMETGIKEYDRKIQLLSASSTLQPGENITNGVYFDKSVGNRTTFDFSYIEEVPSWPLEIVLKTPSGEVIDSTYDGYGADLTFKLLSIKINDTAEPGYWTYTVCNIGSSSLTVFTAISAQAIMDGVDPILVTSELSSSLTDFNNAEPLILYAEVRQGLHPVVNAKVTATVERPGAPPMKKQLLDNGVGFDITREDGIYTHPFTEFSEIGFYGIKIDVNDNNGMAVILRPDNYPTYSRVQPYIDTRELIMGGIPKIGNFTLPLPGIPLPEPKGLPAPRFSRGVSGGSSRVPELPDNWSPGDDIFAPNRILDLAVTSSSRQEETVTLEFTATGDDLDSGRASYYVIRRSTSLTELRNNYNAVPEVPDYDLLNGTRFSPRDFGVRELFVIKVSIPNNGSEVSYHFAIHAVDDAGNAGGMSNIVSVTFVATIVQSDTTTAIPSTVNPSSSLPVTVVTSTVQSTMATVSPSDPSSSSPVGSTLGTTHQQTSTGVPVITDVERVTSASVSTNSKTSGSLLTSSTEPPMSTRATTNQRTSKVLPVTSRSSLPIINSRPTTEVDEQHSSTTTSAQGPHSTPQEKINEPETSKGVAGLIIGILTLAISTVLLLVGLLYLYAKKRAVVIKDDQEKAFPLSEPVHKIKF